MSIFGKEFSADAVRDLIEARKAAEIAEKRAYEEGQKAEREKLKASFQERKIQPEALERIAALAARPLPLLPRPHLAALSLGRVVGGTAVGLGDLASGQRREWIRRLAAGVDHARTGMYRS